MNLKRPFNTINILLSVFVAGSLFISHAHALTYNEVQIDGYRKIENTDFAAEKKGVEVYQSSSAFFTGQAKVESTVLIWKFREIAVNQDAV